MAAAGQATIVALGNEKGGSGKSTTAMHLVVALLRAGRRVASVDLDDRQGSLSRYLDNRRAHARAHGVELPMPDHEAIDGDAGGPPQSDLEGRAEDAIERLRPDHDVIVIDTPGGDSALGRLGHSYADTLITPLNDSFVDLDVLGRVDSRRMRILGPSHYAEMVWEQKMRRARRDGGSIDWIVMRNRLSSLDASNKREMASLLHELSQRIGFRTVAGFGERVVYRELFLKGLTMMDLREVTGAEQLNLSHVAARQEVRTLVDALDLPLTGAPAGDAVSLEAAGKGSGSADG